MVSDQLFAAVKQVSLLVRDTAKADATKRTGGLARGYKVKDERDIVSINGSPRAAGRVYNSDPAAVADEFGNSRQPAKRTLRKAGAKIGEIKGEPG